MSSFNSTTSYMDPVLTPETIASVELSSRNFTVSFTEQQSHLQPHETDNATGGNYSGSFSLHRSGMEQPDSPSKSFKNDNDGMEKPSEMRSVNEISEIQQHSRASLHYQASTSQILEGPMNSSIEYPNNSTPRKETTKKMRRSEFGDCVKELVFDSDNSIASPPTVTASKQTISSIRRASGSDAWGNGTSFSTSEDSGATGRSVTVEQGIPSASSSHCTSTFTTYNTMSDSDPYVTQSASSRNADPSCSDILSCTVDSDATLFMERPLNRRPVTHKVKSSKYRKMAKRLRNIGRQIQKGSKSLTTLAIL